MKKSKNLYIGKGFSDFGRKNMEERGVAIESLYYSSIPKGTKIHGSSNYCAIEQNGKVLGRKEHTKFAYWSEEIEKLAPTIKGSFFGLGPYKNVTITGINSKGFSVYVSATAKSANGVTCNFYEKMSVYISTIDIKKFRTWMRDWGGKFGLKKKGDVWISCSEWQTFITKMLLPFTFDSIVKTMKVSATGTYNMSKNNSSNLCEQMRETMKNYLLQNLGLQVSFYFAI